MKDKKSKTGDETLYKSQKCKRDSGYTGIKTGNTNKIFG